MGMVPSESSKRQREVKTGNAWRLWTYLCEKRNVLTGQCNPSQQTIARDTGIEFTRVSVAKAELTEKGWITWTKKGGFVLLVGVTEFERMRAKKLAEIRREERRKFANGKVEGSDFAKRKVAGDQAGEKQSTTLRNANSLNKGYEQVVEQGKDVVVENDVANRQTTTTTTTTTTSSRPDKNAWKNEPADQAFCESIVQRGLFSQEVVEQAWKELLFTVMQRGPGAVACKAELLGFCRAKQKTGVLPGTAGPFLPQKSAHDGATARAASTQPEFFCEFDSELFEKCPLCFGSGMEVVPGHGARRCPNRRTRKAAGGM